MSRTSKTNKHSHNWSRKKRFTGFDQDHRHRIDIKTRTALLSEGHRHMLLGKG